MLQGAQLSLGEVVGPGGSVNPPQPILITRLEVLRVKQLQVYWPRFVHASMQVCRLGHIDGTQFVPMQPGLGRCAA